MKLLLFYFLINFFGKTLGFDDQEHLKYKFTSGTYLAREINVNGIIVHKLASIPYANVPFAFEKSTLKTVDDHHEVVIDSAAIKRKICIEANMFSNLFYGNLQPAKDTEVSFDCLRVDLYIPIRADEEQLKRNLTALVFIHGGSNASGTSSTFDGSIIAAYGDVVVAIPNYRLDVLGFFHSKENGIHGNYGLWDQAVALEWMYKNCENLGCNKDSITVFGHSAGAADSMILGMSKQAQNYINRMIVQSGSALAHWAMDNFESTKGNMHWERKEKALVLNFLQVTTCEHTLKYQCMKQKLHHENYVSSSTEDASYDEFVFKFLKKFLSKNSHFELMEIFNYIYEKKKVFEAKSNSEDTVTSASHDKDYLNEFKLSPKAKSAKKNKREHAFEELLAITKPHSECIQHFENRTSSKNQKQICRFVALFSTANIEESKKESHNFTILANSVTKILGCFHHPYEKEHGKINHNLVIQEMKNCTNEAIKASLRNDNIVKTRKQVANGLNEIGALIKKELLLYTPVVDHDLIEDNPFRLLNDERFLDIDVIVGVTSQELFYMLDNNYPLNDVFENLLIQSRNLKLSASYDEKLASIKNSSLVRKCLKHHIFSHYKTNSKESRIAEEVAIISDYEIKLAFMNFVKIRAETLSRHNTSKLFVYEFSHVPSFNYLLEQARSSSAVLERAYNFFKGRIVPHNSELDYVFGLPMLSETNNLDYKNDRHPYDYTEVETKISTLVIKYWTNFAKYGNPNTDSNVLDKWKPFKFNDPQVLKLNSDKPSTASMEIYFERIKFWYDTLLNSIYSNCTSDNVLKYIEATTSSKSSSSQFDNKLTFFAFLIFVLSNF